MRAVTTQLLLCLGVLGWTVPVSAQVFEDPPPVEITGGWVGGAVTNPIFAGTIYGGSAANADLTLEGTADATKTTSYILMQATGGRVGIGLGATSPGYILEVASDVAATIGISQSSSNSTGAGLSFLKSNGTRASPSIVVNGDRLGFIAALAYTGATGGYLTSGQINFEVDGVPVADQRAPSRIEFVTNLTNASGVTKWVIPSTGHFIAEFDNTYDIGASGATRPRTGYFGTSLIAPLVSSAQFLSTGTAPAVSNTSANSCGTTAATLAGTDTTGVITVGATAGTDCTVTFVLAAPTRRQCWANNEITGNLARYVYVDATHGKFQGTFVAGDTVSYGCFVY